jgi:hypothetical protein
MLVALGVSLTLLQSWSEALDNTTTTYSLYFIPLIAFQITNDELPNELLPDRFFRKTSATF